MVKCKFCDEIFRFNTNYLVHLKTKHSKKENICRVLNCYKEFEFPYELKLHKIKVHLEKEAPFFCQLCKFPFAVKIKYQEHLKLHKNTKKNSKKFECNVCHKFFYYEQTLKNHKILLH